MAPKQLREIEEGGPSILYRFVTDETDRISEADKDILCGEYVVLQLSSAANSGLMVYGKSTLTGEWIANPDGGRPVIRRLLYALAMAEKERDALKKEITP